MTPILKDAFSSKKFIVLFLGVLVMFAPQLGLTIDDDTKKELTALFVAYLIGQGVADHGKEAMQEQAKLAKEMTQPPTPIVPEGGAS